MKRFLQIVTLGCFVLSPWYVTGHGPSNSKREGAITKSLFANTYHTYYYIRSIGVKGKLLSTNDETMWRVSNDGAAIVRTWTKDTPLIIMLNNSWFSSHKFCLKNTTTNQIVPVSIFQGPLIRHSIFIKEKSPRGSVALTNGSRWSVGYFTSWRSKYKSWRVGHAIFIGESKDWLGSHNVLININSRNYLDATKLSETH